MLKSMCRPFSLPICSRTGFSFRWNSTCSSACSACARTALPAAGTAVRASACRFPSRATARAESFMTGARLLLGLGRFELLVLLGDLGHLLLLAAPGSCRSRPCLRPSSRRSPGCRRRRPSRLRERSGRLGGLGAGAAPRAAGAAAVAWPAGVCAGGFAGGVCARTEPIISTLTALTTINVSTLS